MKKPAVFVLGLLVAAAVVSAVIFATSSTGQQSLSTGTILSCTHTGKSHLVLIKNNRVLPRDTSAKACDTLTIKNTDAKIRLVAFGEHDHHTPYDGTTQKVLDKNQSLTLTLNQAGSFEFHDHLEDSVQGAFIVVK